MKFIKAILITAALAFCVSDAKAQFATSPTSGTFTNVPSIIETAGVSNINAQITIVKDANISILPYFAGTNAGTANLHLTFKVSTDGSSWTTVTPVTKDFAMNGDTAVRGYALIKSTDLNGMKYLQLATATNAHTASLFVTNITYSFWR